MRRVSKLQLLLAPVLLAASVGCAFPGRSVGCATGNGCSSYTSMDRSNRLMQVAAQYEKDGKPDLAYKMYKHLASQDSENQMAKDRMELIAKGQSSTPGIQNAPMESHEKALVAKELLADIKSRQSEEAFKAALLKQQKSKPAAPTQSVADIDWDAISPRKSNKESLVTEFGGTTKVVIYTDATDLIQSNVVNASQSETFFQPEPVVHVEKTSAVTGTEWWSGVFDGEEAATPTAGANTNVVGELNPLAEMEAVAEVTAPVETGTVIVDELTVWTTTGPLEDFPTPEPEKESVWAPTSLARYCPEMPTELHPQIRKLDSSDVQTRIEGLQEIRQMGSHAESVDLAVRELMVDSNDLVKAHAAGTLHFISGETSDSITTLANVLDSDSPEAVRLAAYLLGKVGPAAAPAREKLESVRDNRPGVTGLHAAEALTRISSSDHYSFDKLTIALFGADEEARWFAAISLGAVSDAHSLDAAKALKEALRDGASKVRAAAALSLGGLGESARIALDDLKKVAETDNQEVRDAASMALVCLEI